MDEPSYAKFAEQVAKFPNHVAIQKKPKNLTAQARYGYNFVVGNQNRGWILDGNDHGWVLYLDWKGDGDLSNTPPQAMKPVEGVFRLQVDVSDGDIHWPCRFEVTKMAIEGKEKVVVKITDSTIRSGVIDLDGRKYPFQLHGSRGQYNGEYDSLEVDRFGNGEEDAYKVPDRFLNLAGKSYEFSVEPNGDHLALTELAEARPDRASLKAGTAAPTFAVNDIDGHARKLEDYRGKIVLVEFWSTLCGPCRMEMPHMVDLYAKTSREKIEFLGISSDDDDETLRDFMREFKVSWPQSRGSIDDGLHKLYRIGGIPTYFLIGTSGDILDAWTGSGETMERVSKFLATK